MRNALHHITSMKQAKETDQMKFSVQLEHPQSPPSDSDGVNQAEDQRIVVPAKFLATADGFEKTEHSW